MGVDDSEGYQLMGGANSHMQTALDLLVTQARMFEMLGPQRLLDGLEHSEAVAPILDPTLCRAYLYSGKPELIKRILRSAVHFQNETLAAAGELLELQQEGEG